MPRLTALSAFILPLIIVSPMLGEEFVVPTSAQRVLDRYQSAMDRAESDLKTAQERYQSAAQSASERAKQDLLRMVSRIRDASEQAAVWREILRLDPLDQEARSFFSSLGILERVIADLETPAAGTGQLNQQQDQGPTEAALRWQGMNDADRLAFIQEFRHVIRGRNPQITQEEIERRIPTDAQRIDLNGLNIPSIDPIAMLPVTILLLNGSSGITSLEPLRGMRLSEIHLHRLQIQDLSPLHGMPLQRINISENGVVENLDFLHQAPLVYVHANRCQRLQSIAGLVGAPIRELHIDGSQVSDLSSLHGAPIVVLNVSNMSRLNNLAALKGAPLSRLIAHGNDWLNDLSALQGSPLTEIHASRAGFTTLGSFQGFPIQRINLSDNGRLGNLQGIQGLPVTYLNVNGCSGINDLAPLQGVPLNELHIERTRVRDITPLARMPISTLNIGQTQISDLRPLQASPIQRLYIRSMSNLRTLAPISRLPLRELYLSGTRTTDQASVINNLQSLTHCDWEGWSNK